MRYLRICVFFTLSISLLISCQKERSFETDKTPAHGSLHSNVDDECLPKRVNGIYLVASALTSENYIEVEVDVATTGAYNITSDTINGYSFKGSGNFTTTGTNTVKLIGNGLPGSAVTNNFLVTFDSSFCYVPVVVLPAGTGAANYSLAMGSGTDCMTADVLGSYVSGVPLGLSNTVAVKVNVTSVGTYSISTNTVNGITFSGTGVFTSTTSPQTVILTATGTPANKETSVLTVTAGTSSCTFNLTVTDASAFDYFPRTSNSNWSYEFDDDDNDSLLRVSIPQTAVIGGNTYNLFIETTDAAGGYDSSGYYRKSGGNYYEYLDVSNIIGFGDPTWIEYIFLKDDVAAGTSWTSSSFNINAPAPLNQITVRVRFTVSEKDVTVTVNGKAYPNTIVVEQKGELNAGGTWTDMGLGTLKDYYARDIGVIKREVIDPSTGTSAMKMELRRSEVY